MYRLLRNVSIGIAVFVIIAFLGRNMLVFKQKSTTQSPIHQLRSISINDHQASVLIRGTNPDNPILLFIHGMGYPDMMFSRCFDQCLLEEFTVVRYDQRGVGKSQKGAIEDGDLTIETYVNDLLLLTDSIQTQFPKAEIYLVGHSWGTVLGLQAITKAPEKYACYIGIAQIVHQQKADRLSYEHAMVQSKQQKRSDLLEILSKLNPATYNLDPESLAIQRKCLKELGGTYFKEEIVGDLQACVSKSPEHSVWELLAIPGRGKELDRILFPQLLSLNFFESVPKLDKPIFLMGGRSDYMVSSKLANQYLEEVEAPHKEFIWFERSGHLPIYEENEKFCAEMKRIKKKLAN